MEQQTQFNPVDDAPNTVSAPDQRYRIGDLPRDMREELFNEHATNLNPEATERGFYSKTVPCGLIYIRGLTVSKIPSDQLDSYMQAKLVDLPPIVIADGRLIDGQHRILSALAKGVAQLRYIDVTGLIDTNAGGYVSDIPFKHLHAGSLMPTVSKPSQLDGGHDFKTSEGSFTSYFWNGNKQQGEVTIEKAKTGYLVRNIFLHDGDQRKGIGSEIYAWVNDLSVRATGNPMRSTKPRNLLGGDTVFDLSAAGKRLWKSLESKGFAVREDNGSYVYKRQNEPNIQAGGGAKISPQVVALMPIDREAWAHNLLPAGKEVDGRLVRSFIPNRSSIDASIANNEVLSGVRVVPLSAFDYQPSKPDQRVSNLAAQIAESGEINPLIIGVDCKGPYVIEGGHRLDALFHLGAKCLPGLVVLDLDELENGHVAALINTPIVEATTRVEESVQLKQGLEGTKATRPRRRY